MAGRSKITQNKPRRIARDINERKVSGEKYEASDERYRLIVENAHEAIIVAQDGFPKLGNPKTVEMTGYTWEELVSKPFIELVHPDDRQIVIERHMQWLKGEEISLAYPFRFITKDGDVRWAEINGVTITWEGIPASLNFLNDVTERKRAEEALSESEEKFRDLFENANDMIQSVDIDGSFVYVNRKWLETLGYSEKEIKKLKLPDILRKDQIPHCMEVFQRVCGGEQIEKVETVFMSKDGREIQVEGNASARIKDGRFISTRGIFRDITERKQAEEALYHERDLMRTLFEIHMDFIYFKDREARFHRVSKRFCDFFGRSEADIIGKTDLELFPEEVAKQTYSEDLHVIKTGIPIINKEESANGVWVLTTKMPWVDKDGDIIGLFGISREITERKRAETALREGEERWRSLVENAPSIIMIVDRDGTIQFLNRTVPGFDMEEVIGRKFYDYVEPKYHDIARKIIEQVFQTGETGSYVTIGRGPDGRNAWYDTQVGPIKHDGLVTAVTLISVDATERRQAEETVRESEERFRALIENSLDVIMILNSDGTYRYESPSAKRVLGYEQGERTGHNSFEYVHPDDVEEVAETFAQLIQDPGSTLQAELRVQHKDGSWRTIEATGTNLLGNQAVEGIVTNFRDITERKRAEEELRRSEERLRHYLESTPDIVFNVDSRGTFLYVSGAVERITGHSSGEIIGKNFLELGLLPPEYLAKAAQLMESNRDRGSISDANEFEWIRKDGSRVAVEVSSHRMGQGDEAEIIGVVRDITERKKSEEALRQSEHNYKVLFESTIDGMAVIDAETMRIVLGNQRLVKTFGFDSAEAVVGVSFLDLIHPEDRERAMKVMAEDVFEKDLRGINEFRTVAKEDREPWVSVVGTRTEYQGRLTGLVSVRDITERKKAEEEKYRMEQQLQLAGRLVAVGELAAGVAHELNNPLAAVQMFAQFLNDRDDLDETTKGDVETIYREAQRAARITSNLLSFARKHTPEKCLMSFNEVVEKSLELNAYRMRVNNIEVSKELDPDLPMIMADFYQMQQVFTNIITNAEQTMTEAHGKGKLLIKTQKVRNMIRATFTDDGPGILEEDISKLFDPFFTTKDVGKGTGLGLSICFGLVHGHNGRIYAKSKPGKGATFVVEMPIITEEQYIAGQPDLIGVQRV